MKIMMVAVAAALAIPCAQAQDHGHLNAGAVGWNQGDKLTWVNGADFLQSSGYVKTLLPATTAKYLGFFDGNITLTALHSTNAFGEAIAGSPAPGAFILGQIVSVTGPEGAFFGFWDTNSTAGNPTFSIPTGTQPLGAVFDVSQAGLGAGSPGGDPYGHIHGRRLTATKPGLYTVGFRSVDNSTNGSPAGPIHAPSETLTVQFQAGYNIKSITWTDGVAAVTIGTAAGSIFALQSNADPADPEGWTLVSAVTGNDKFQTIVDGAAAGPARFYRVEVRPANP